MPATLINKTDKEFSAWRSSLLWLTLFFLAFESVSGFGLFFFRPFFPDPATIGQFHTLVSLGSLVVIWAYLVRHYQRVRFFSSTLHYRLGILSLACFVIVALSGAWIWLPTHDVAIMDLIHIVSGFGFMVLLAGHLTLVIRLNLQRQKNNDH
jgi:Na+/melibiose symporter-like transporter